MAKMIVRLIKIGLNSDPDVVLIRQRAREISGLLGFGAQDQVRIATAVSELARHICALVAGGRADFALEEDAGDAALVITISSGSATLRERINASVQPQVGMPGFDDALINAQRLMDACRVDAEADGASRITLRKRLPPGAHVDKGELARLAERLACSPVANTYSEVQLQNRELLATLAELREKQDSLLALTQELEDTNRGVVALYAEIEEKAERLRNADELKSRFLSNTSHELRTPLSSIRALARLLLDRIDGELTEEQEKQIGFIDKAACDLSELVNDLLDLAKIESGKVQLSCAPFSVANLFSALRGMLRPLVPHPAVELQIEDPHPDFDMLSDEGKVSQILRNFLSNALKFTESGEVRMRVAPAEAPGFVRFTVADTGIGIAPENQQFVFEEFSQIENPLQRKAKGTGLGLPLCRKLANLLGGRVELRSELGTGSVFSLVLPMQYAAATNADTRDAFDMTNGSGHD